MRPINLLPAQAHRRASARRSALLAAAVAIVFLAGLAALTMLWNSRVDSAEQRLADQQAVNRQLQAEVSALSAADELRLEYEQNALMTAFVLATDVAWGRLLNDFGRLIPERVWLENFVGTVSGAAVPGLVGRVTVSGTGFDFADVSAWLRSLDEARFPGVTGSWVSNASEALGETPDDAVILFSSTAGLTEAAVSNRVQERIPEVAG